MIICSDTPAINRCNMGVGRAHIPMANWRRGDTNGSIGKESNKRRQKTQSKGERVEPRERNLLTRTLLWQRGHSENLHLLKNTTWNSIASYGSAGDLHQSQ